VNSTSEKSSSQLVYYTSFKKIF